MKKLLKTLVFASPVVLWACTPQNRGNASRQSEARGSATFPASSYDSLSGPYVHENLTIFLVHGKDDLKGRRFLTLQEALQQKKIRVHETGNVNQLSVENLSDEEIFIQSGEIVRGGKQDRVLAVDLILKARSGRTPIAAFCVEQGRWRQRGGESTLYFDNSSNMAPGNELAIAVKKDRQQGSVWSSVSKFQGRLNSNLDTSVADSASPSSLELSLENAKVKQTADSYVKSLHDAVKGHDDAIGLVAAINGELLSADVYGSPALFRKLLHKLLQTRAIEAIALLDGRNSEASPDLDDARAFLNTAAGETVTEKKVSAGVRSLTRESRTHVVFETVEAGADAPVHRNVVKKP